MSRFFLALLCALALLTGCVSGRMSKAEADGMFRSAMESMEMGDYRTAIRRFQIVREKNAHYPNLQHNLGICYAKVGLHNRAVEALKEAVADAPEDLEPKIDLAVALEMAGSPKEAEKIYLALTKDHPNHLQILLNLGLLYARPLNNPEQAKVYLEHYLQLNPTADEGPQIRRWLKRASEPAEPSLPLLDQEN